MNKRLAIGLVVAVGLGAGGVASSVEAAVAGHHAPHISHPRYKKNSRGQTIGPLVAGSSASPDLVPLDLNSSTVVLNAVGESWTNGEASPQGYVYSSDVAGEQVTSPSQAAEYMQDRVDADGDIWIDLYEVDGKTVIGRLILGHVDSGNSVDAK